MGLTAASGLWIAGKGVAEACSRSAAAPVGVVFMSERHAKFFNKRACYLLIAGAFLFLSIFIGHRYMLPDGPPETAAVPVVASDRLPLRRVELRVPVFDAEAYDRPIIENNLFRPLGWTPPRPLEPHRLIGTILARDADTPSKAIIETTAGNQKTYIVSTGDKLSADTEVVSIQPKQVTLSTNGQQRSLSLNTDFWIQ